MWPHQTHDKYEFDESESTLAKVVFSKGAPSQGKVFFGERFFSIYSHVKIHSILIMPPPYT